MKSNVFVSGFLGSYGSDSSTKVASLWAPYNEIVVPLIACIVGCTMMAGNKSNNTGCFVLYFGMQTGMNLFMKLVLSEAVVSEELGLRGIPAPFFVTAVQQFTAFFVFVLLIVASRNGIWPEYQTKVLTTRYEWAAVIVFSSTFALNVALNNYSLSLLSVSLNMVIRSCLPLGTLFTEFAVNPLLGLKAKQVTRQEVFWMNIGVMCAAVAVFAQHHGAESLADTVPASQSHILLGVSVATLSIFCGSLNMVFAGLMGTKIELNPVDSACYMSLPAAFFLVWPAVAMPHPVGWPSTEMLTDSQVARIAIKSNSSILNLVILSGIIAFLFNVLVFTVVQKMSANHAACAGNFNKAAAIVISIVCGTEIIPPGFWGFIMLFAIAGNMISFTLYSLSTQT